MSIPTEDEGFVIEGNCSIMNDYGNLSRGGSLEVFNTIFTDKLSPYTLGSGISILNTNNVSSNTSASVVFYGGTSFIKESRHTSFIDIQEITAPSAPTQNFNRLYIDSTTKLVCILDSSNTLSTLNPLTTLGDILTHNGTTETRIPVGSNGQGLIADSTQPTGLRWGTIATSSNTTASNIGAGIGIFRQKTGDNLEFKSVTSTTSRLTIVDNTTDVGITLNEESIVHQNLSGVGTNTHAQIDTHIANTSNPHIVTINQIKPTTTKGDIIVDNGTIATRLGVGTNGQALIADSAQASGLVWSTIMASDTTTASNIGAGIGIFRQKTGDNLEFKSVTSTTSRVTIVDNTTDVGITLNEGSIVHQNLSGAGTNTHAQIDTHIANTSNPHSTTINQIKPTTTKGDIIVDNGTIAVRLGVGTNGQALIADSAQASGLVWSTITTSDTTTASNIGAGIGIFRQKTGDNLEFKSVTSTNSRVTIVDNTTDVGVTLNEGSIVHQNLSGAGTNTHAQIDTHIANTNNPHATTINQIKPTTTKGDLIVDNGTIATRLPAGTNGQVLIADSAQATGLVWSTASNNTTASNIGGGIGIFRQKTGNNLEFKSVTSTNSRVTIVDNTTDVGITLNEGSIVHQNLSGAGTNTHAQIDTHIANTSNPHSTTINQIKPTTTKGDLIVDNGTIATRLPVGTNGQVLIADSAQATGLVWSTASNNTTASNIGAGIGIFRQKTGNNLEFKSVTSTTSRLTIVDNTTDVGITLNEGSIVHQNLSGAGTNTHAQIDTHIANTSNPHATTINQIKPTTTKGDLIVDNGTIATRLPVGTNAFILSANSAQATGLEWVNITTALGDIGKVAVISDQKAIATAGGTFTNGAWRTRTLNTITGNAGSIVTLASNRFTLLAGNYFITASSPANIVRLNVCRLQNITDGTTTEFGISQDANPFSISLLKAYISIASTKVYELQHRSQNTRNTDGFGTATGFQAEVYAVVTVQVV